MKDVPTEATTLLASPHPSPSPYSYDSVAPSPSSSSSSSLFIIIIITHFHDLGGESSKVLSLFLFLSNNTK
jgi:hypothetical protein